MAHNSAKIDNFQIPQIPRLEKSKGKKWKASLTNKNKSKAICLVGSANQSDQILDVQVETDGKWLHFPDLRCKQADPLNKLNISSLSINSNYQQVKGLTKAKQNGSNIAGLGLIFPFL